MKRDAEILREPTTRTLVDWTPERLRRAEHLANGGALTLAADVCEWVAGDDRVVAVLGARVKGLLGRPVAFEPGRGRKRGSAVRALEAEEDWWHALPEAELARLLGWGILLGVGVGALTWGERRGRMVPRLEVWSPRHLRFDAVSRAWRVAVEDGQGRAGEREVDPESRRWVLYTPTGASRPWTGGAWRALGLWCLLKRYAQQDWARYSERQGAGVIVGTVPEGAPREDRERLAEDLAGLGRDTAIALPAGFDVKLVESIARTWDTFKAQIDAADTAVAILLAGQNLTTEVQGGSLAAAQVHARVGLQLIRGDAETLATTLHDQVLAPWAELNFGASDAAPWPEWDVEPPEDAKAHADIFVSLGTALAQMQAAGVQVDVEALAERFNLPLSSAATTPPAADPVEPADDATPAVARLASGDSPATARGFFAGQRYTDAVADGFRDRVAEGGADLARMLEVVSVADSPQALRRLVAALAEGSSDETEELAERTFILAELAGRTAVLEDL